MEEMDVSSKSVVEVLVLHPVLIVSPPMLHGQCAGARGGAQKKDGHAKR